MRQIAFVKDIDDLSRWCIAIGNDDHGSVRGFRHHLPEDSLERRDVYLRFVDMDCSLPCHADEDAFPGKFLCRTGLGL